MSVIIINEILIRAKIKDLEIEHGTTKIEDLIYQDCYDCEGILTIPDTVTRIGESAFEYTYFEGDLIIPDSVTYIGDNAFHGCSIFESQTLSTSLEYIGKNAFDECDFMFGDLISTDSV